MRKITIACLIIAFLVSFIGLQIIADMGAKQMIEAANKEARREFMGWHGEERAFFDGKKVIYE